MNHEQRLAEARAYNAAGLRRVTTASMPDGQKYAPGTRVRIAADLGPHMWHFPSGMMATVRYTYAHAYGGTDVDSYCLDVDGYGEVSWYHEHQLSLPTEKVEAPKRSETKVVLKRLVRLSADDWSEVGDLIAQCIEAADVDESYTRQVRDKAMAMMVGIRNEAVDNGLRKKANTEAQISNEVK